MEETTGMKSETLWQLLFFVVTPAAVLLAAFATYMVRPVSPEELKMRLSQAETEVADYGSELSSARQTQQKAEQQLTKTEEQLVEVREENRKLRSQREERSGSPQEDVRKPETDQRVAEPAPRYEMTEWKFTWPLVETGDISLKLVKNPDGTHVSLHSDYDYHHLTPSEAQDLYEPLAAAPRYAREMRGAKEDVRDTQQTNSYVIEYSYSTKRGFGVNIRRKSGSWSFMNSLSLELKDCRALAPILAEVSDRADDLDKRINP